MPIFIKYDGVEGSVTASSRAGGGPRVYVYDGSDNSAVNGGSGGIPVSGIELPNSAFGAIDALAPNAVVQARALFDAQRTMVTSLGVIFSIAESGANKLLHSNNLRQISIAAHGQISTVRLFITDASNPSGVIVTLENVRLSESLLKSSPGGERKKVRIDFCKTN